MAARTSPSAVCRPVHVFRDSPLDARALTRVIYAEDTARTRRTRFRISFLARYSRCRRPPRRPAYVISREIATSHSVPRGGGREGEPRVASLGNLSGEKTREITKFIRKKLSFIDIYRITLSKTIRKDVILTLVERNFSISKCS